MPPGYTGKVLRVDLAQRRTWTEEPPAGTYRTYLGGRALIAQYLLRELRPGTDPLGPENILVFATGVLTGVPVGGSGRNGVGARSPLTGAFGVSEAGGYFGAELKRAGFDAIVVHGKAASPAYLYVEDGRAEIRDAGHLWGLTTGESQERLHQELGDRAIRTAQIGPAGEKLVRYACVINDLHHAAGRTGMGAVMGSKNLKTIAVRGHKPVEVADPGAVAEMGRWLRDNVDKLARAMRDLGTAGVVTGLDRRSGLPTRHFRQGQFEGAQALSGRTMRDTILVDRGSCFACPVRCKRVVQAQEPFVIDRKYGGPEYETLAALGSLCGVSDLAAVCKAGELCNAYGLDTISTGVSVAFAMEASERGLLSHDDTDGLEPRFGDAGAMVALVERIARRQGLGDLLAEGVARAAARLGPGAQEFALHVKGQEVPMHEPRLKFGLGLGYALSPTGAEHCNNMHDTMFTSEGPGLDEVKPLGILEPVPANDLGPAKVRLYYYYVSWRHLLDSLVFCDFVPLDLDRLTSLVSATTGWDTSLWELLKVGERCHHLARAFNVREGFGPGDDRLPERFFSAFDSGPLAGVAIDPAALGVAKRTFYEMAGWDKNGVPTAGRLAELNLGWVSPLLPPTQ
ncbi:MAG: aldehyde ferredoxin oxidoreductase family protein [Chloroflexi bacterium]|nr:aldehyde ferredoxin oxidoreductase family protein [Chloroflexota bacterium]